MTVRPEAARWYICVLASARRLRVSSALSSNLDKEKGFSTPDRDDRTRHLVDARPGSTKAREFMGAKERERPPDVWEDTAIIEGE